MTERCTGLSSPKRHSSIEDDASCRPSPEQSAAKQVADKEDAERAAEQRRNDYFANNTDEGGRCARASSDARSYSPMLKDDPIELKNSRKSAALDGPIESDPLGNAIIAALAGGLFAGVGSAAASGTKHVAVEIGKETGKAVVKAVAKEGLKSTLNVGPEPPPSKPESTPKAANPVGPVGKTGANGTSEVVPEPNQSAAPVTATHRSGSKAE